MKERFSRFFQTIGNKLSGAAAAVGEWLPGKNRKNKKKRTAARRARAARVAAQMRGADNRAARPAAQKSGTSAAAARTAARPARKAGVWQRLGQGVSGWWQRLRTRLPVLTRATAAIILAVAVLAVATPIVVTAATKPAKATKSAEPALLSAKDAALTLTASSDALAKAANALKSPSNSQTVSADADTLMYQKGDTSEDIMELQARLMELGYMDNDEPTDLFGPATKSAVELFQRKHGYEIDGRLDEAQWAMLFSDAAQKYSVSTGVAGDDVRELQIRLRELGYLDKVTSYYGDETTAAVKKFQTNNKLTADGTIGTETREKLYSDDVVANSIKYGENSDKVLKFQKRLAKLGYMEGDSTGYFGPATMAAVKKFQQKNGLIADGAIGPQTEKVLMSSDAQINALLVGDRGNDVTKAQNRLVALKYMTTATGYYGSGTEAAVRAFQSRNGLAADGKIGPKTSAVLFSSDARKAASTSKPSNSNGDKSNSKSGGSSSGNKGSSGNKKSTNVKANATDVASLIKVAKSKLGTRYVRGGKGPDKFDCSGFVYWCLKQIGVKQGYMTSGGWRGCGKYPEIHDIDKLQKGDIIVFRGHVAISLGGGQYIDASSSQGKIRITGVSNWARRNFIKGCRVL